MTEAEWLACRDARRMLEFLIETGRASDRKLRLFVCAFSRWQAQHVPEGYRRGMLRRTDLTEQWAETGKCPRGVRRSRAEYIVFYGDAVPAARTTARAAHEWKDEHGPRSVAIQPVLLRELFGNPFRAAALPVWLSADVKALARGIYDERAFERMPILADALEDAGCADAELLGHCRGPAQHLLGCWAVDALLGKG